MAQTLRIVAFLNRLKDAVRDGKVMVSAYAIDRALDEFGWGRDDILLQLRDLRADDFLRREISDRSDEGYIWVFCPPLGDLVLWIRIRECRGFLVVSFHEA